MFIRYLKTGLNTIYAAMPYMQPIVVRMGPNAVVLFIQPYTLGGEL